MKQYLLLLLLIVLTVVIVLYVVLNEIKDNTDVEVVGDYFEESAKQNCTSKRKIKKNGVCDGIIDICFVN